MRPLDSETRKLLQRVKQLLEVSLDQLDEEKRRAAIEEIEQIKARMEDAGANKSDAKQ
jgi:hypothetical protein